MTTINQTPAGEQGAKKRLIHRFSWVSLLVCWLIWVLNAYDREMILRLGPVISKEFSLSPEQWGNVVALIMVALAVLDIPGSIWSDRYGSGWKRARFQVPLGLGYTALSFISGIKAISHGLTAFVLIKTQHHSSDWYCRFVSEVTQMAEVLGFWRMAGEYDYLLRVQVADMKNYDDFYKRLVNSVPGLSDVTSSFAMEQIKYTTALPID